MPPSFTRRRFLSTTAAATGTLSRMTTAPAAQTAAASGAHPHLCITCGSQFSPTDGPPKECPICLDERQYVGANGQEWNTLETMKQRGAWKNIIRELEPGLHGIGTEPKFGIGQRALLVQRPQGNILWDCISYLDEATISAVKKLGASQRSRFPTRTTTAAWPSGAGLLATCPSICTRRTGSGSCGRMLG
ncbi:hypothetical protein [Verrucomicrobium spinosum]|uniref:hypothetical protein n=1 Tax=Verrucomicrobium spinosum TaxID=2736 RepID=UPI001C47B232|nr:hypothetical protein [Verrucomicrobium spinosum]